MKKQNPYDSKYADSEYYWGKKPSKMCETVLEIMRTSPGISLNLLDLGCGEGRNAVYFAKHGFDVIGLDPSLWGLNKTKKLADEMGVNVATIHADIITCKLDGLFDVIFSTGTLHYLPPAVREQRFVYFKEHTSSSGINAFSVFVEKPFITRAPDAEDTAYLFTSGELMSHYRDWEILFSVEEIFDCMSGGKPHKHAVNRIIAKRYSGRK